MFFRDLKKLTAEKVCKIKVVNFSRNFGKEAALLAGLENADGEYTAIIDADLQQNPKYILEMLDIIRKNPEYDGVAAYQRERNEGKVLSFFKNCFYKLINKMTEVEFYRSASDFRVLSRKMVDAVLAMPEKCRFSKGIFSWIGFNVYYMPYDVESRLSGSSKWSFWKLTAYAVNGSRIFGQAAYTFIFCRAFAVCYCYYNNDVCHCENTAVRRSRCGLSDSCIAYSVSVGNTAFVYRNHRSVSCKDLFGIKVKTCLYNQGKA